jgi:hypothetical protein
MGRDDLEGFCAKCGRHYFGWALRDPARQKCGHCGGALEIIPEGSISSREAVTIKEILPLNDNKPGNIFELHTPGSWIKKN